MYGANPSLLEYVYIENLADTEGAINGIAASNIDSATAALFAEESLAKPSINEFIDTLRKISASSLSLYTRTSYAEFLDNYNPKNIEPYKRVFEVQTVSEMSVSGEQTERTLEIHYIEKANTDMNRADEIEGFLIDHEGVTGVAVISFRSEGDREVITELNFR